MASCPAVRSNPYRPVTVPPRPPAPNPTRLARRVPGTVDMSSTGTDIRPLECLLFRRDVKSQSYYEQMTGRGTRVIDPTDLKSVTPDTERKTHFVLVDAVGG